jgi:hypothetical protein
MRVDTYKVIIVGGIVVWVGIMLFAAMFPLLPLPSEDQPTIPKLGSVLNRGGRIIEIEHITARGFTERYIVSGYFPPRTDLVGFSIIKFDAQGKRTVFTDVDITRDELRDILAVRQQWCAVSPRFPTPAPDGTPHVVYRFVLDCDDERVIVVPQAQLPAVFAALIARAP